MWRGRDLCRGVYRKLSKAWQREEACHTLKVWAASHLSYPVDWDPCYQFEWSLGKCYFKNLIYIYISDYQYTTAKQDKQQSTQMATADGNAQQR